MGAELEMIVSDTEIRVYGRMDWLIHTGMLFTSDES
jgi:hypothetical protein